MILLDTDHLTVLSDQRHTRHSMLMHRIALVETAIPIVVAEEQLRGFIAMVHRYKEVHRQLWGYEQFFELIKVIQVNEIIPFDRQCLEHYELIVEIKPRIGTQDLKIAAIALTHDALLVSSNLKDLNESLA